MTHKALKKVAKEIRELEESTNLDLTRLKTLIFELLTEEVDVNNDY